MKRFFRVILRILGFIIILIIAVLFWVVIIFLPGYIGGLFDDKEAEPTEQVQYKNIELKELSVGIPWNKDLNRRSTTIGGIKGKVFFDLSYETKNHTIGEIRFFSSISSYLHRDLYSDYPKDTLPIQNMINDIEQTFNIEFMKAPKNSEIDLYTIKDSVEFNCSYTTTAFWFSMIHRYD